MRDAETSEGCVCEPAESRSPDGDGQSMSSEPAALCGGVETPLDASKVETGAAGSNPADSLSPVDSRYDELVAAVLSQASALPRSAWDHRHLVALAQAHAADSALLDRREAQALHRWWCYGDPCACGLNEHNPPPVVPQAVAVEPTIDWNSRASNEVIRSMTETTGIGSGVLGAIDGRRWRKPYQLLRLIAIAEAHPSVAVRWAWADGTWFYCITGPSNSLTNWMLQQSDLQEATPAPQDPT